MRRENCVKNIGNDKYAFTEIQMWFIPKLYRAPKGTGISKIIIIIIMIILILLQAVDMLIKLYFVLCYFYVAM